MFTSTGSDEIAVEAMKAGMADYVPKSSRRVNPLGIAAKAALDGADVARRGRPIQVRLETLLDQLELGIYRTTRDGRLLDCNAALLRILGLNSHVEALARNVREFYAHLEDRFTLVNRLKETGFVRNYEVKLRRANGEPCWVCLTVKESAGADGNVVLEGVMADVRERKRVEHDLVEERNVVSAALEAAAILIVLDEGGRIVHFNRPCERATDYSFEEVNGREIWGLFVPQAEEDVFRELLGRLWRGALPIEHAGPWITRGGDVRHIAWSCRGQADEKGSVRYAICTGVDMTESRRVEEQLRQVQKMEAIGRLAGNVAHDLDNLLTTILGYSTLLLDELEHEVGLKHDVVEIRRAAERAVNVTRQLLAFGRQQVLQPRLLDLNAVLAQVDRVLRRAAGNRVQIEMAIDADLGRSWSN